MLVSAIFGNVPGRYSLRRRSMRSLSDGVMFCSSGYSALNESAHFLESYIFDRSWAGNSRAELAARMSPFVSRDWLLRNVFHFSEEEIDSIEQQCLLDSLVR